MHRLAELIRKGLATEGVREDKLIWGAGPGRDGKIEANVVGLALIALVGKERAVEMFEAALKESLGDDDPAEMVIEICDLLELETHQTEELVALQWKIGAAAIADRLESGEFTPETAPPPQVDLDLSKLKPC